MELLDIQIDLYHFKRLLKGLADGDDTLSHETVANRLELMIDKYSNSSLVTEKQMGIILEFADTCFSLMITEKAESFMDTLLQTRDGLHLRERGLRALLEKPFATLYSIDKVYLLYLEFYCNFLGDHPELKETVDMVRKTVGEIRYTDNIYQEQLPYPSVLAETFEKMDDGNFRLTGEKRRDVFSGCGFLGLVVASHSGNEHRYLNENRIACKPIAEGMAFPSKMGVYDNLQVEATDENRKYMESHNIRYAVKFSENKETYIIDSDQRNTLLHLSYRDLISLWPKTLYFVLSTYMLETDEEKDFVRRKDYCWALAPDFLFTPLSAPAKIVRLP